MTKLSTKQLQAKVKAAQKENKTKIEEAALRAKLEATLVLESSKVLFDSKVKLAVTGQHTKVLQDLVNDCSGIVDSIPVHNKKTRKDRVWAGQRKFAHGEQVNLMYQLASGIMYSCAEHKQLLLAHTGLNPELITQFVEAFGSPAYYSHNLHAVVEAKPYTLDDVLATVAVMQSELGVIVDTSQLTTNVFSSEITKGKVTSELDKLKADEAVAELDMSI